MEREERDLKGRFSGIRRRLMIVLVFTNLVALSLATLLDSAQSRVCYGCRAQRAMLRLRGGTVADGREGRLPVLGQGSGGLRAEHSRSGSAMAVGEVFAGEVELSLAGQSLDHIVENANGPLRVTCQSPGAYSWDAAVGVQSPDAVEVVGVRRCPSGVPSAQARVGPAEDGAGDSLAQATPILAGQWFMMEESHGTLRNLTLVHRCPVDRRNLETRVDMMIVAGGKWEVEDCSLWTWWGGVLTCMESAHVIVTNCIISGGGDGDKRAEFGVSAFDRARIGLRLCLLQHVSAMGARFHDESQGVLSNCTLQHCQVALALDGQPMVTAHTTLFTNNTLANLCASDEAVRACLTLHACRLLAPIHPAGAADGVDAGRTRAQDGTDEFHWLTQARPGKLDIAQSHLAPAAPARSADAPSSVSHLQHAQGRRQRL